MLLSLRPTNNPASHHLKTVVLMLHCAYFTQGDTNDEHTLYYIFYLRRFPLKQTFPLSDKNILLGFVYKQWKPGLKASLRHVFFFFLILRFVCGLCLRTFWSQGSVYRMFGTGVYLAFHWRDNHLVFMLFRCHGLALVPSKSFKYILSLPSPTMY